MTTQCDPEFIRVAEQLADAARPIARRYFRAGVQVDQKADNTMVTAADREIETVMRGIIGSAFPDHKICGEEQGGAVWGEGYQWVLDPIDGTLSFINGVPLFTTIVGIVKNGIPWFGLVDQPVLQDRWVGGASSPTTRNGKAARVRPCESLAKSSVYVTAPDFFDAEELRSIDRLTQAVKLRRYGGTDCYHYGMVASGWTDMACETLSVYEYGAMVPIIENAGGVMTDWRGEQLSGTEYRQVLASGDRKVHAEAVAILSKESS